MSRMGSNIRPRGAGTTNNRNPSQSGLRDLTFGGNLNQPAFDNLNNWNSGQPLDGNNPGFSNNQQSFNRPVSGQPAALTYGRQLSDQFRTGIDSAMQQMLGINLANQNASLMNKALTAQVLAASLPAQYQAQAAMYGSDNNLRGTQVNADANRHASDNTLQGNVHTANQNLAGTQANANANVQATGLTANSALEQARLQAAANQAISQQQTQALLDKSRIETESAERLGSGRNSTMLQALGGFTGTLGNIFGQGGALGGIFGGGAGGTPQSQIAPPSFQDPYQRYAQQTNMVNLLRGAQ